MMAIVAAEPVSAGALADAHREHYRSLVRLAALLLDDIGTCEEVVQDAFVRVFARPRRLADPTKTAAYLRSAVLNGARSQLRRREVRRRPETLAIVAIDDDTADADPTGAGVELATEHQAVLDALPPPARPPARDVLVLRFWGDASPRPRSPRLLGIAAGTVKTHAGRGLAGARHDPGGVPMTDDPDVERPAPSGRGRTSARHGVARRRPGDADDHPPQLRSDPQAAASVLAAVAVLACRGDRGRGWRSPCPEITATRSWWRPRRRARPPPRPSPAPPTSTVASTAPSEPPGPPRRRPRHRRLPRRHQRRSSRAAASSLQEAASTPPSSWPRPSPPTTWG